ncbi:MULTISPECIES: hypothetical protein [unclassified Rathayibacter]|uniref:hypothetical protein n=1 Tax=unclassified Rathayibacter TaxID=2609250 RepID=UPI001404E8B2|nr:MULTISPECIES: hypothetical protein [unclassified Rathayibacter]
MSAGTELVTAVGTFGVSTIVNVTATENENGEGVVMDLTIDSAALARGRYAP